MRNQSNFAVFSMLILNSNKLKTIPEHLPFGRNTSDSGAFFTYFLFFLYSSSSSLHFLLFHHHSIHSPSPPLFTISFHIFTFLLFFTVIFHFFTFLSSITTACCCFRDPFLSLSSLHLSPSTQLSVPPDPFPSLSLSLSSFDLFK